MLPDAAAPVAVVLALVVTFGVGVLLGWWAGWPDD